MSTNANKNYITYRCHLAMSEFSNVFELIYFISNGAVDLVSRCFPSGDVVLSANRNQAQPDK